MKQNWKPILVLLLLVAAVWYLVPTVQFYGLTDEELASKQRNAPAEYYALQRGAVNLGLDLQGGIHLVMEVDLEGLTEEEQRDAVDRAQEVIRNRVDQFGVAEPTIQRQGENRIIVELPGLQDVERAKGLIGQTALLEFQLVEPDEDRNRLVQRISKVLAARGRDSAEETESPAATDSTDTEAETPSLFDTESEQGTNLFDEVEETSDAPTLESMLTLFGNDMLIERRRLPAVKAMLADPVADGAVPDDVEFLFSSKTYEVFEGRLVRATESSSGALYYVMYLVRKKPEMTGNLVESAYVSIGQNVEYLGQPIVNFETTDEGVRVFRSVTGGHIGERLGIVLDGAVYSAPTIQTKIYSGRSIITGSGTEEEAKDLGIVLRAGALPARVEIIEDRTVGPSLGHDSIEQGKVAGIISMILIAVFMLLYYRLAGFVANIALALNMVFVLAVLAGFHATLTLPGIAGIILTIGMAVDANVLIFKRIREELRAGKTVRAAIDSGYNNALSAIIDANLTTFIVGLVLYEFGSGPIRGFALTLCIGIVSSLFTAFIVTRLILEILTRSQSTTLSIGPINILANVRIRFLSMRKTAMVVSGGVLAIGLISVVGINHLKPGIDFAGGTLLELHFDPPVSIEQIRDLLDEVELGDSTTDLSASEIKRFGSDNDIIIRVSESETGTDVADGIKQVLKSGLGASIQNDLEWVRRQEKVGPKIGFELREKAVQAVLTSLVLILVYMAWRFRQFLFGIAAVVALFHDVLITLGLLSLLDIEITLAVVAALLAIVGYSLNDTIVVFDRVRENLLAGRARDGFAEVLDISINECLSRTVVTSLTTLFAVVVLMGWGGEVIRDFTITLFIGILVGTYSSVFVASPVLYYGHARSASRDESRKRDKRK